MRFLSFGLAQTHFLSGLGVKVRWAQWMARAFAGGLLLGLAGLAPAAGKTKATFDYFAVGVPVASAPCLPHASSSMLMGGGPDVDAAFVWMIQKSNCAQPANPGNFVVIRATGTDAYNPYIYAMGGVAAVQTLIVKSREGANDPALVKHIDNAAALFIAGGDQRDYYTAWKGTALDDAIKRLIARNAPIGGTSAGLAVLAQFDFVALRGTVTSEQALADPYNRYMTLARDFITTTPGFNFTLADAHLDTRDRMGRLLTFLARTLKDNWASVADARAIGVDVDTALLVEGGVASRVGLGAVYFLSPTSAPAVCVAGQPLTFRSVKVRKMADDSTVFNLGRLEDYAVHYYLNAEVGVLTSSNGNQIY